MSEREEDVPKLAQGERISIFVLLAFAIIALIYLMRSSDTENVIVKDSDSIRVDSIKADSCKLEATH